MICDHEENGRLIYESEDNRCDTDRGVMGEINYFCKKCGADITEEVEKQIYGEMEEN